MGDQGQYPPGMSMDGNIQWYTPPTTQHFVETPRPHVICMWCGAQIPHEPAFLTMHEKFHEWVNSLGSLLMTVTTFFEQVSFDAASEKTQQMVRDIEGGLAAVRNESNSNGTGTSV